MSRRDIVRSREGREPQGDADFVRGCRLDRSPLGWRVALGVRRVIAALGEVEPPLIHAEDRIDGPLADLSAWDSLDMVEMLMEVEEELDVAIPRHEAERIRNPDVPPRTVGEFVGNVDRVVRSLKT